MNADQLYWGLKFSELITLIGIIVGPIAAVIITLQVEPRRRLREQQTHTMRMLMSTRHLPSDPAYTIAINMIPIDFNKNTRIMKAWEAYWETIRYNPTQENLDISSQLMKSRQTQLIFEILKHLGYRLSEADIQNTAYAADGFIKRDNLNIAAWSAWPRIADALEAQLRLMNGENSGEKN